MRFLSKPLVLSLGLALASLTAVPAQAQLFGDDQARQAILELRSRLDQAVTAQNRLVEENTQLRRGMLDLQQQLEQLREDMAQLRGQSEQFERQLDDSKTTQEERLRRLEVGTWGMSPGGNQDGHGEDAEVRQAYDEALSTFRAGDFQKAQAGFAQFIRQNPTSGLAPLALFWLGNAQYATRNYEEAISNFRSLLAAVPQHDKAPDAMLSIANCQIELGDTGAARQTLQELTEQYPQSGAAQDAKDRLQRLS